MDCFGSPLLATHDMVFNDPTPRGQHSIGAASSPGPAVSGMGDADQPLLSRAQSGGLAHERVELLALGLSEAVVAG